MRKFFKRLFCAAVAACGLFAAPAVSMAQTLNTDITADVSQYVPAIATKMGGTITAMLAVGLLVIVIGVTYGFVRKFAK